MKVVQCELDIKKKSLWDIKLPIKEIAIHINNKSYYSFRNIIM